MNFKDERHRRQFEDMYEQYKVSLRTIAYKCGIPREEMEDVIHDAFVSYARSDYDLELPEEDRRKLLSRILKNRCIDYFRELKRHGCYSLDYERYYQERSLTKDKGRELVDDMIGDEKCRAIIKEIQKMPENWKEVAILKMLEGRSTEEVCEILNISEKACYSRVARIRKYLDKLLKDENWP